MAHQANKPFKIFQVLNLFCSRQGPLCVKEASGFLVQFYSFCIQGDTLHYAVHCSPDAVHSELQCDLQETALLLTPVSTLIPPTQLFKGSGGDSMSPIDYTVPAGTSYGSRNLASGSNQSMNISGNQVPKDFQRRTKPSNSSQSQMTPEWSQLSNFPPPL